MPKKDLAVKLDVIFSTIEEIGTAKVIEALAAPDLKSKLAAVGVSSAANLSTLPSRLWEMGWGDRLSYLFSSTVLTSAGFFAHGVGMDLPNLGFFAALGFTYGMNVQDLLKKIATPAHLKIALDVAPMFLRDWVIDAGRKLFNVQDNQDDQMHSLRDLLQKLDEDPVAMLFELLHDPDTSNVLQQHHATISLITARVFGCQDQAKTVVEPFLDDLFTLIKQFPQAKNLDQFVDQLGGYIAAGNTTPQKREKFNTLLERLVTNGCQLVNDENSAFFARIETLLHSGNLEYNQRRRQEGLTAFLQENLTPTADQVRQKPKAEQGSASMGEWIRWGLGKVLHYSNMRNDLLEPILLQLYSGASPTPLTVIKPFLIGSVLKTPYNVAMFDEASQFEKKCAKHGQDVFSSYPQTCVREGRFQGLTFAVPGQTIDFSNISIRGDFTACNFSGISFAYSGFESSSFYLARFGDGINFSGTGFDRATLKLMKDSFLDAVARKNTTVVNSLLPLLESNHILEEWGLNRDVVAKIRRGDFAGLPSNIKNYSDTMLAKRAILKLIGGSNINHSMSTRVEELYELLKTHNSRFTDRQIQALCHVISLDQTLIDRFVARPIDLNNLNGLIQEVQIGQLYRDAVTALKSNTTLPLKGSVLPTFGGDLKQVFSNLAKVTSGDLFARCFSFDESYNSKNITRVGELVRGVLAKYVSQKLFAPGSRMGLFVATRNVSDFFGILCSGWKIYKYANQIMQLTGLDQQHNDKQRQTILVGLLTHLVENESLNLILFDECGVPQNWLRSLIYATNRDVTSINQANNIMESLGRMLQVIKEKKVLNEMGDLLLANTVTEKANAVSKLALKIKDPKIFQELQTLIPVATSTVSTLYELGSAKSERIEMARVIKAVKEVTTLEEREVIATQIKKYMESTTAQERTTALAELIGMSNYSKFANQLCTEVPELAAILVELASNKQVAPVRSATPAFPQKQV